MQTMQHRWATGKWEALVVTDEVWVFEWVMSKFTNGASYVIVTFRLKVPSYPQGHYLSPLLGF